MVSGVKDAKLFQSQQQQLLLHTCSFSSSFSSSSSPKERKEIPLIFISQEIDVPTKIEQKSLLKKNYFKPRKNPVLLKVDLPGVLEVDCGAAERVPAVSTTTTTTQCTTSTEDLAQMLQRKKKKKKKKTSAALQSSHHDHHHRFSKVLGGSLVAEPPIVVFDNYIPYQSISKTLIIKNVSKVAHRLRVSFNPPGSYPQFFQMNLIKTPIDKDGLIAPGLACAYSIDFTPNSFANTNEELLVSSENGETFTIPILALRPKPDLKIPPVLNIGYCMEGRELVYETMLVNEGGESRFSLMLPNVPLGPFELFEEIGLRKDVESKPVTMGSFTISPSFIYANHGDAVNFKLKYTPAFLNKKKGAKVGSVLQRTEGQMFQFACDNCDIMEVEVVATVQEPKVDVISYSCIKDGLIVKPFNLNTMEEDFQVVFGQENFGVPKICVLKINNPTNLEIPFDWKFVQDRLTNLKPHFTVTPDRSDIFSITPQSGTIAPLTAAEFTITFLSKEAKTFTTLLEMIIPPSAQLQKSASKRRQTPDVARSVARIQLLGQGICFNAQISTDFIILPQGFTMGDVFRQKFSILNDSISDMNYEWEIVGLNESDCNVVLSNRTGMKTNLLLGCITPNSTHDFDLEIHARLPSYIKGELRCRTASGFGPTIVIPLWGSIRFPTVQLAIERDFIDLGLLSLGSSTTQSFPLKNTSKFVLNYELVMIQTGEQHDCYFKVEPWQGQLEPEQEQFITVTYVPFWYQQLRATLQVFVVLDEKRSIASATDIIATTETPLLVVRNPENHISCFEGVPFSLTAWLENTRDLPAKFSFVDVVEPDWTVHFHPPSGKVRARSHKEITLSITCFNTGEHILDLVGNAIGMVENIGFLNFKVHLHTYEPTFAFRVIENEEAWANQGGPVTKIKNPSTANLRLDFGVSCPIFGEKQRTIKIRNKSPFPSPFNLSIEKYRPTLDNVEELTDGMENHEKSRPKGEF